MSLLRESPIRSFGWLFATLITLALLSQPGATHNEWQHLASTWCGSGDRRPYCSGLQEINGMYSGVVNFAVTDCASAPDVPLTCTPSENFSSRQQVSKQGLSLGFYVLMSWLVGPSIDRSVVLIRLTNALLITALLGLLMHLLPSRHRVVLILTISSTLTVSGLFLFASVNPASWSLLGVGVGWLAFHAVFSDESVSEGRRRCLIALGTVCFAMSLTGGRYALYSLAVPVILLALKSFNRCSVTQNRRQGLLIVLAVLPIALMTARAYGLRLDYVALGIPSLFFPLGAVPTSNPVRLPLALFIGALVSLALLLACSYNRTSLIQSVGSSFALAAASFFVVRSHSVEVRGVRSFADAVEGWNLDLQMSFQLFVFSVSWWFLHGPPEFVERIRPLVSTSSRIMTLVYAITSFSLAERNIDRQQFGVRLLPDGPDQWWWDWLPLPPSVIQILSVLFFWRFLIIVNQKLGLVAEDRTVR